MPWKNRAIGRPDLFHGLGLGQAQNLVAVFPAVLRLKQVNALKALENVAFLANLAAALEARMT